MDDRATVGAADIADVGADQLIGPQAGQQGGQDDRAVAVDPVAAPPRLRVGCQGAQQGGDRPGRQRLGDLRAPDLRHRVYP
jgi:hypothetical protein